jgi:hypothetical protein
MKLKPLAAGIAMAIPVSALAATFSVTPATTSTEFLTVQGGITAPAATLALGAQYAAGDVITFTFSAPPRAATNGTTGFTFPSTLAINNTTAGALALFDSSDTSVSYRVTSGGAGDNFGSVILPTPIFQTAGIANTDVTVSASSATSQGTNFDSTALPAKLIDVTGSQFIYTVTGLSEVVDVESARKKFLIGTTATNTAAFVVAGVTSGATSTANLATAGTMSVTIAGDFAWLDASSSATGVQPGNISGGTTTAISATGFTVSLPSTGGTITLTNSLANVIATGTVTATISGTYSGSGSVTGAASGSGTGTYSLNGSTITVYAVPTSAAASNFIWLTNSGSTSGDVSITVNDAGTATDLGVVGTSVAGAEFDVSKAMADALAAQGVTLSGGRVHLDIVTNVPAADVAISAAYRVGDDRVNLLTSIETDND